MDDLIGNTYKLVKKIGQGSFGRIYKVEDPNTKNLYAMKLESYDVRVPQLLFESRMYNLLRGGPGIPQIWAQGSNRNGNYIVIDLLGKSLEALLNICKRCFSLKTVLMLADQMLDTLEFFHKHDYIHRDVKPDNFVIGIGSKRGKVFIIDYGLAKRFRDSQTGEHLPYREGLSLSGTARYASIPALSGIEQSRRDDMEGLAYLLIYLLKGSLPWQGIDASDKHVKHQRICKCKQKYTPEELCKNLPEEFSIFLRSVRDLGYYDEPDYDKYRTMFRNLFKKRGYEIDFKYDWDDIAILDNETKDSFSSSYSYISFDKPDNVIPKKYYYLEDSNNSRAANTSYHAIKSPSRSSLKNFEEKKKKQLALSKPQAIVNPKDNKVKKDSKSRSKSKDLRSKSRSSDGKKAEQSNYKQRNKSPPPTPIKKGFPKYLEPDNGDEKKAVSKFSMYYKEETKSEKRKREYQEREAKRRKQEGEYELDEEELRRNLQKAKAIAAEEEKKINSKTKRRKHSASPHRRHHRSYYSSSYSSSSYESENRRRNRNHKRRASEGREQQQKINEAQNMIDNKSKELLLEYSKSKGEDKSDLMRRIIRERAVEQRSKELFQLANSRREIAKSKPDLFKDSQRNDKRRERSGKHLVQSSSNLINRKRMGYDKKSYSYSDSYSENSEQEDYSSKQKQRGRRPPPLPLGSSKLIPLSGHSHHHHHSHRH